MKRNYLIIVVCFLVLNSMPAFADLAPTVMLRHNKQSTMYSYYQIQDAVNAAVAGDTIYLSEGTFRPFNIDKRIMVRGAGPATMIEGSCEINISGSQELSMPVLDAMCFSGDINVTQAPRQLTFRKCKMANVIFSESNDFYDVKIDRCWITNRFNLPSNVKEFNAFNSKIQILYPHDYSDGQATFTHCNIVEICAPITGAQFISSRIKSTTSLSNGISNANLLRCVLRSCTVSWSTASTSNVTGYNNYQTISGIDCSSENEIRFNTNEGLDYKYTNHISAEDGTYVGAYGGQHPFTQYPEVPGVTQHQITIDAATKTMTVKLTVDKLDKQ